MTRSGVTWRISALVPAAPIQGREVFTEAARFPKGMPEGVSTGGTLREDLKPLAVAALVSADLHDAWCRVVAAARTDRARRKAHRGCKPEPPIFPAQQTFRFRIF